MPFGGEERLGQDFVASGIDVWRSWCGEQLILPFLAAIGCAAVCNVRCGHTLVDDRVDEDAHVVEQEELAFVGFQIEVVVEGCSCSLVSIKEEMTAGLDEFCCAGYAEGFAVDVGSTDAIIVDSHPRAASVIELYP